MKSAAQPAPGAVIGKYCATCHSQRLRTSGLDFESIGLTGVADRADVWEKVIRKLRTGTMPPAGAPRPDQASYESVASWLENEIDRAQTARPTPGRLPALHRLNRAEYKNAIRDLLLVQDIDITSLLPADDASYGFDNMADTLWLSPTLLERYLAAAQKVSRLAIGDGSIPLMSDTYRIPPDLAQDDRLSDLPFGTRGGIVIRRDIPLDGEYQVKVELPPSAARAADPHTLEISVDGEQARLFAVGGRPRESSPTPAAPQVLQGQYPRPPSVIFEASLSLKAGPRAIAVTFVKKTSAQPEDLLLPFLRPSRGGRADRPTIESVTISGPFGPTREADTPARRRIFVCHPSRGAAEAACARQILSTLARRAYRKPATDADLRTLAPFFEAGKAARGFDYGIESALQRILVSPSFLFRVERDPEGLAPGRAARISDLELASRLSFFLWSSIPDDELLELAIQKKLDDPRILEQQVRRMVADQRSQALVSNFTGQWLYLRNLSAHDPDPRQFPDFDEGLRQAFRQEAELFFDSILREDRSALDLLTADYTFVNERLARHYGIPHVYGSHFRRVTLADENRRGLLGKGGVLTVNAYPTRTSPVLRGKWILANVLGAPPPEPPPNVPTLQTESRDTGKPLSMREAMARHRENPQCASCHMRMDPLGFALENFDAVGRWRTVSESNTPVDAEGVLPDGTRFTGAAGLRAILLARRDQFVTTLTEKLLTYGLGRGVEYYDWPAIRRIVRDARNSDYRMSALVLGIVKSVPFQMRGSGPIEGTQAAHRVTGQAN